MSLLVIILVLILLFGGVGYYGNGAGWGPTDGRLSGFSSSSSLCSCSQAGCEAYLGDEVFAVIVAAIFFVGLIAWLIGSMR
jgi:hypothetical protein